MQNLECLKVNIQDAMCICVGLQAEKRVLKEPQAKDLSPPTAAMLP